jgi:hypothetical protein
MLSNLYIIFSFNFIDFVDLLFSCLFSVSVSLSFLVVPYDSESSKECKKKKYVLLTIKMISLCFMLLIIN